MDGYISKIALPDSSVYDIKDNAARESIEKKVFIDDRISGIQEYSDLSIIKLSAQEYDQLVTDNQVISNGLYIVEDDFEDAYGQQIKNLAPGTDLSDAVNLEQLSNALSSELRYAVMSAVHDSSLSLYALADRTVNIIDFTQDGASVPESLSLAFPDAVQDAYGMLRSRDFYASFVLPAASIVPSVFVPASVALDTEMPSIQTSETEAKSTAVHFTEVSSQHFIASSPSSGGSIDPVVLASKLDSSAAAPEFDVLSTYSPWQYVTYEGKLWRFTTHHVSGDWNASQAELVDMTTPDATLDLMNDGRLRVVSADGTSLWTQGYSMVSAASSLSTLLSCEAVNFYKYAQTTASAFSDLSTYAAGDRVIYQSSVYKFNTAHAAGAWTSAEVDLDPDSHMFMMPSVPAGKVGDFVLDIDNTANAEVGVIAALNGLSTAFDMYVPAEESLPDILSFEATEQCELYFTMTAFGTAAKPAWKVVKQVVEKQGAGT